MDYVDKFLELVHAMHDNDTDKTIELLEAAPVEMLQALVDVGRSMETIAKREAERRDISLFTPWNTFLLSREE